ncbi:MAG TPA: ATP-binding protein [Flavobacterium sp.]
MELQKIQTEDLRAEIEELKHQLYEANSIIDAIKDGSVDALVLNKDGKPHVYSIESADYTYRILIEKFGEGALSISDDGLILYCNEYFSKLIDIPANQITGTFFHSYVDSVTDFQLLKIALQDGPSKGEIVLNINGRKLHVYVSLTDLKPNVAAIGVVITDLTEKRKHQEALVQHQVQLEAKVNELHQTNTNLEEFIHVISHDIKEPIRKLITYTSYFASNKLPGMTSAEQNSLSIINSSSLRLNSLVDDLVKYAFIATKAEETEVCLEAVLQDVLEDLELMITENNAVIKWDALPKVFGSRVQMRQLFANLLVNAIKYSKDEMAPEINITAENIRGPIANLKGGNFHKIAVSDNGIGMDSRYLAKIFTIFQRLHMRNEYSGNGIGLSICKKIMENHSGKIAVESSSEGSTFILYFPIPSS